MPRSTCLALRCGDVLRVLELADVIREDRTAHSLLEVADTEHDSEELLADA